jgi:GNAT superfamily N-acetyltransferase
MPVSVRPSDYASDREELVAVLQANLPYLPHATFFPWQYLRNPDGQALTWVATDCDTKRIIGVAAAFPRRLYCSGADARGYVLGDFCIDPSHRSLGLAVALQRACLEALSTGDADFVFDFPSRTMLAVYTRLGIEATGAMIRYAKPLRADRKIANRVPVPAIAHALSAVANAGLRLRDSRIRDAGEYTIAVESGPWQEEFTQATRKWSASVGICLARTAAYLNWRYNDHPQQQYQMLAARRGGTLCGYLLLHRNGSDATIDDLVGEDDSVRAALLMEAIALARQHRLQTLSAPWLSAAAGEQLFNRSGFRPRESISLVTLTLPQASRRLPGEAKASWYLTHGDRES